MRIDSQPVQRARSGLPIGAWWALLGPLAGLAFVEALLGVSGLVAFATNPHPNVPAVVVIATVGAVIGLVLGGLVGVVGAVVMTIVDDVVPDRPTPRIDVTVAMLLAVVPPLWIALVLGRPLDIESTLFVWGPVVVVPALAAALAAWIWRRTRG